jgi:DNA mismatch repair ATPase MutS
VDFILTTHYTDICSRWGENDRISNWQMTCNIDETGEIEYTYSIERGISKVQGAIKVLRDMNYPTEILGIIEKWDHAEADD